MRNIVLFHSGLGLRPAVHGFADRLRASGHTVHVPDIYDGEVFDTVADGVRKRDSLGVAELARRSAAAVESLPSDVIYAGFSLGAAAAAYLATTRPGARAAVLMQGAPKPEMWGVTTWPKVPVQLHYAEADPWVTSSDVESLATMVKAGGASFEAFVYPGSGHLFADDGLPEYDAASTEQMLARVLKFV